MLRWAAVHGEVVQDLAVACWVWVREGNEAVGKAADHVAVVESHEVVEGRKGHVGQAEVVILEAC